MKTITTSSLLIVSGIVLAAWIHYDRINMDLFYSTFKDVHYKIYDGTNGFWYAKSYSVSNSVTDLITIDDKHVTIYGSVSILDFEP